MPAARNWKLATMICCCTIACRSSALVIPALYNNGKDACKQTTTRDRFYIGLKMREHVVTLCTTDIMSPQKGCEEPSTDQACQLTANNPSDHLACSELSKQVQGASALPTCDWVSTHLVMPSQEYHCSAKPLSTELQVNYILCT